MDLGTWGGNFADEHGEGDRGLEYEGVVSLVILGVPQKIIP